MYHASTRAVVVSGILPIIGERSKEEGTKSAATLHHEDMKAQRGDYFIPRFFFSMSTWASTEVEQRGHTYRLVVSLKSGSFV
jgi:hypothetical protein